MSDPVSALQDAEYHGRVRVRAAGLTGMVTIRAELAGPTVKSAIGRVTGVDVPGQGATATNDECSLLWMSPDELLLVCPYDEAPDLVAELTQALAGRPHLVANVSDARAVFDLTGAGLRNVLAKLTPIDLRGRSFLPGQVRRTRLAQVAGAIWLRDEESARLLAFRSVAPYVFDLLKTAADPAGAFDHF